MVNEPEATEETDHIEALDPTWTQRSAGLRAGLVRGAGDERMAGRLAVFSLLATLMTVLVSMAVLAVGVVVLLAEPDPVVFDRDPPPRRRAVARRSVARPPPVEADGASATPDPDPAAAAPGVAEVAEPAPAPAPEVPSDLFIETHLVPGILPGTTAPADEEDDSDETDPEDLAPEALGSERVTVGIGSDPPGADVILDGRFRGRTPVKLMLNPGRYTVDLKLQSIEARWKVDATQDLQKCFSLQGSELVPTGCR